MMGLLHCSGKFRAYLSSNTPEVGVVNGKISTTNAEFDLSADKKEDVTTKLILMVLEHYQKFETTRQC